MPTNGDDGTAPPPDPQVTLGSAVVNLGNTSGYLYYDATTNPKTIYPTQIGGTMAAPILSDPVTPPDTTAPTDTTTISLDDGRVTITVVSAITR